MIAGCLNLDNDGVNRSHRKAFSHLYSQWLVKMKLWTQVFIVISVGNHLVDAATN